MPRDSGGVYTLPAGNPVIPGTVITSTWANDTMDDLAVAITDSLDRNGRGGMLAPFEFTDGIETAPGFAWANEPTSGFFRESAGDFRATILGSETVRFNSLGIQIWNTVDLTWDQVLTNGGALGLVPVSPGTTDGDTLEWDNTGGVWVVSALKMVPVGGAADQTLRWDDTGGVWAVTSALSISDAGAIDMTSTLSVVGVSTLGGVTLTGVFDGGTQVLTNVGDPVDDQDAVTKAYGDANYAPTGNEVPDTRTLTAGDGLTGGGDLTADRTFDVVGGDGINANADDIEVDATVVRTAFGGGLNLVIDSGSPSGSDPNTIYFVT